MTWTCRMHRIGLELNAGHQKPQPLPVGLGRRLIGNDPAPVHDADPIRKGQDFIQLGGTPGERRTPGPVS